MRLRRRVVITDVVLEGLRGSLARAAWRGLRVCEAGVPITAPAGVPRHVGLYHKAARSCA
jgi:hypothetical protein